MDQIVARLEQGSVSQMPTGQREAGTRRSVSIDLDAEIIERQLKRAVVRSRGTTYEIHSDEQEISGGDDSAPTPLMYFSAGIAF